MIKGNKLENNKKKKLLIIVIALVAIILGSILIRNVIVNQGAGEGNYRAGENSSSTLIANNIKKGITIGGITGTLEDLDTSDATATEADILKGKTAYVDGKKITGTYVESTLGTVMGNETKNSEVNDKYGNKVEVPAGFKIANPDDNVEDGIVIEDVGARNSDTKGSQFVWIPVGKIQTSEGEKEITLGRYTFDTSGNETLVQSSEDCVDETQLKISSTVYQELLKTTSSTNTKAKDIANFVKTVTSTGGYYIGRYEAGDVKATTSARTSGNSLPKHV